MQKLFYNYLAILQLLSNYVKRSICVVTHLNDALDDENDAADDKRRFAV